MNIEQIMALADEYSTYPGHPVMRKDLQAAIESLGQPTFVKHEVESAEDWSEWVCPDPNEYLIKCCDCGLVHEAQFRVAKYKPLSSEEFTVTDNPNVQAQFRMKRHSAPGAQPKEQS
jgi:hypothetical protein